MNKFNIEEHVINGVTNKPLVEAKAFAELHGYTIRIVKKWYKGMWSNYIIKTDYDSKRINVGIESNMDEKVHHVAGLG